MHSPFNLSSWFLNQLIKYSLVLFQTLRPSTPFTMVIIRFWRDLSLMVELTNNVINLLSIFSTTSWQSSTTHCVVHSNVWLLPLSIEPTPSSNYLNCTAGFVLLMKTYTWVQCTGSATIDWERSHQTSSSNRWRQWSGDFPGDLHFATGTFKGTTSNFDCLGREAFLSTAVLHCILHVTAPNPDCLDDTYPPWLDALVFNLS